MAGSVTEEITVATFGCINHITLENAHKLS